MNSDMRELQASKQTISDMNTMIHNIETMIPPLAEEYQRAWKVERISVAKVMIRYEQDLRRSIRIRDTALSRYIKLRTKLEKQNIAIPHELDLDKTEDANETSGSNEEGQGSAQ